MVTKTYFNTKIAEIKGKTPDTTHLASNCLNSINWNWLQLTALTAVESKIPSVVNLVKKSKIIEIEKKINDHNHDK